MSSDITMTMPMSSTSTMSGMSMATSTSDPMSSMMSMDMMAMTFFTGINTPLFSMNWMPNTTSQYAGTCVFLIIFAIIFRGLLAIRVNFFTFIAATNYHRSNYFMNGQTSECKQAGLRSWKANEALMMATLDLTLAGIGYLLMIAVMTMNVGYFLSVLAGVFVGSFMFSRYLAAAAAH